MLHPLSSEQSRRLLDFFSESGYTLAALADERKLTQRASRRFGTVKFLLQKTEERTLFNTLARLFAIGVAVPSAVCADLVPQWALDLLEQSGMIRRIGDQFEPAVMLSPLGTMLVASDPVLKWEDDPEDLILWPNPTTQQLFNFTVRKPFKTALDLGSGCGVQGLGAAEHCESVVASDLNPRAAGFTEFNARLNGIENIECLTGDCFEPVQNRRFDLIVANPPFFITPSSKLMYCENTMELDLFSRRLAREAPGHLNESGFFQMVCEWVEIEGQPWRERIGEWMDGSGCDVWVLKQYTLTPSKYGNERAQQRPGGAATEVSFFADWVTYSNERRLVAVHGGVIAMRKRSGPNWRRIEDQPVSLDAPIGDMVLGGFEARDTLDSSTDTDLLEIRFRLAKDAHLVQVLGHSDPGWSQRSLQLQLSGPRPRQLDVGPSVAQFAGQFDGKTRLGDLIQSLAQNTNAPFDQVAGESVAITRRLLEEGYLEVPDS